MILYNAYTDDEKYRTMLEVYKRSIKKYEPKLKIITYKLNVKDIKNFIVPFYPNQPNKIPKEYFLIPIFTRRIKYHMDFIHKTNDNVIFSDCDMLMNSSIGNVFKEDFDIAFTTRTNEFINIGIIFAKPNDRSKRFFEDWYKKATQLMKKPEKIDLFKHKYTSAIDQCALGLTLKWYEEYNPNNLKVKYFPSSDYNSCQDTWDSVSKNTKFIHIKSGLRKSLFQVLNKEISINDVEYEYYKPIIKKWMKFYKEIKN